MMVTLCSFRHRLWRVIRSRGMDVPQTFDAAATIATYRHVIALRETTLDERCKRVRRHREQPACCLEKKWHGEDSLHDKTFGEP
jgi:hypothetical protein